MTTLGGVLQFWVPILEGLLPRDTINLRFMAEENFDTRNHLVFDVSHDDYQPATAHLPGQGDLPVVRVWLSKEQGADVAGSDIRSRVNNRIREIHDLTGAGSVPPFFVDYSGGKLPTFWNPRTMQRAVKPASEQKLEEPREVSESAAAEKMSRE